MKLGLVELTPKIWAQYILCEQNNWIFLFAWGVYDYHTRVERVVVESRIVDYNAPQTAEYLQKSAGIGAKFGVEQ